MLPIVTSYWLAKLPHLFAGNFTALLRENFAPRAACLHLTPLALWHRGISQQSGLDVSLSNVTLQWKPPPYFGSLRTEKSKIRGNLWMHYTLKWVSPFAFCLLPPTPSQSIFWIHTSSQDYMTFTTGWNDFKWQRGFSTALTSQQQTVWD